jgi:hypothetical protein
VRVAHAGWDVLPLWPACSAASGHSPPGPSTAPLRPSCKSRLCASRRRASHSPCVRVRSCARHACGPGAPPGSRPAHSCLPPGRMRNHLLMMGHGLHRLPLCGGMAQDLSATLDASFHIIPAALPPTRHAGAADMASIRAVRGPRIPPGHPLLRQGRKTWGGQLSRLREHAPHPGGRRDLRWPHRCIVSADAPSEWFARRRAAPRGRAPEHGSAVRALWNEGSRRTGHPRVSECSDGPLEPV